MNRWLVIVLIVVAPCARAGNSGEVEAQVLCTDAWYRYKEDKVPTGDGQGHGPDIGSDEWRSVIEFRLGIRGKADLPARDSEAWCGAIDEIVRSYGTPSEADGGTAMSSGPSYVCDKIRTGSIEAMICEDGGLSRLDRKLADVYLADARHTLCHIIGIGSIPHLVLEKPVRSWSLKAGFQQPDGMRQTDARYRQINSNFFNNLTVALGSALPRGDRFALPGIHCISRCIA